MTVNPTLELGAFVGGGATTADLRLRGGLLGIVGDTERSARLRLAGVGADGPSFVVTDDTEPLHGVLGAGLPARIGALNTLEADVDALLSGAGRFRRNPAEPRLLGWVPKERFRTGATCRSATRRAPRAAAASSGCGRRGRDQFRLPNDAEGHVRGAPERSSARLAARE